MQAFSHDNDVSGGFFILVIIPVAILDSVFYLWVCMPCSPHSTAPSSVMLNALPSSTPHVLPYMLHSPTSVSVSVIPPPSDLYVPLRRGGPAGRTSSNCEAAPISSVGAAPAHTLQCSPRPHAPSALLSTAYLLQLGTPILHCIQHTIC